MLKICPGNPNINHFTLPLKKLEIPYISAIAMETAENLIQTLQSLNSFPIRCNPWPEFVTDTKASFSIAHNKDLIFLKYHVQEQYLIANEGYNGNIHNDSCVEFFVAFDGDKGYYNLEFNCLGFSKIGYGKDRSERVLLPLEVVKKLRSHSRISSDLMDDRDGFEWEILLIIPKQTFIHHQIKSFGEIKARGNFYKCGDGLPQPHFLSWNMINSKNPDFHQRESFGELAFK
ncbi:carbohydrate-binding family 9-like protein [Pedobacter sp. G11]|uniref:carbohydrate-binding family 9-like protein n=1 Tax=Pedobacter sp. G11 TaxID=2482728 RepID=UPI00143DC995|nr:carbohydrate-binding family 9-like protein [Pedobacter sp. G11]